MSFEGKQYEEKKDASDELRDKGDELTRALLKTLNSWQSVQEVSPKEKDALIVNSAWRFTSLVLTAGGMQEDEAVKGFIIHYRFALEPKSEETDV